MSTAVELFHAGGDPASPGIMAVWESRAVSAGSACRSTRRCVALGAGLQFRDIAAATFFWM